MTKRTGSPIIIWKEIVPAREFRGEWRGYRLTIHQAVNVGVMWEGFINGGRVLRARRLKTARERLGKEVAKRWEREAA